MDDNNHPGLLLKSCIHNRLHSTKSYLSREKKKIKESLYQVIPEIRRPRQEDHCKFEASLGYIAQGLLILQIETMQLRRGGVEWEKGMLRSRGESCSGYWNV